MTTLLSFGKATRPALALLGLAGLGLTGCQADIANSSPTPSAGNASFARYIAVGNSLTAGYEDGGLYLEGQQNSYPSILAQQFAQASGGAFNQPLFTTAQASGSGYLRLSGFTTTGSPITTTVLGTAGRIAPTSAPYTKYLNPVDNLGVPGIRMADIQTPNFGNVAQVSPTAATFNPYFERITPDGSNQSYFQRVKAEAATTTFFSCWLGNNDVLGYATSGGSAQNASNTNLATPPPNTITRSDSFNTKAVRIINALTARGAKGVISNIPDVTGIPFFTTVGPVVKATLTAKSVPGLVILTGGNPGAATTGNRKQITTADIRDANGGRQLFTLTSSPFIPLVGTATGRPWKFVYGQTGLPAAGFSTYLTSFAIDTTQLFGVSAGNPIPSAFVLDDAEQSVVSTATTAYNNSLQNAANAKGLAFFDANMYFRGIATTGIASNAVNNTASYISGNLFSLDGVHPTPRGYALIANEIIKAINARYGATVRQVDANSYRGVPLP
jgi:lysophospholipase L1-like esterase